MSAAEGLSEDQLAVISLLLRRRRTYADVAGVLAIDEQAVIGRARAAVRALATPETTPAGPGERDLMADYLLGQLAGPAEASARELLAANHGARVWARRAAAGLDALAPGAVPAIPARAGSVGPARGGAPARALAVGPSGGGATACGPSPPVSQAPSSRLGGAILLAVLGAVLVVAIVLVTRSGEGGGQGVVTGPATGAPSAGATGSTSAAGLQVLARSALAAGPAGAGAQGVAELVSEGGQRGIAVAGQRLTPTVALSRGGFDYALWLVGRSGAAQELGLAPAVGRDGTLAAQAALPARAASFQTVLVTREKSQQPVVPGPVVHSGPLPQA